MRRRQLKWLWARLKKLSTMTLKRDALLMELGAAKNKAPSAWRLVTVAVAFKTLKGDLAIRPIYHQDESRIEAHIFIAFLAYCVHVTLGQHL